MRRGFLFFLSLSAPSRMWGETLYAVVGGWEGWQLVWLTVQRPGHAARFAAHHRRTRRLLGHGDRIRSPDAPSFTLSPIPSARSPAPLRRSSRCASISPAAHRRGSTGRAFPPARAVRLRHPSRDARTPNDPVSAHQLSLLVERVRAPCRPASRHTGKGRGAGTYALWRRTRWRDAGDLLSTGLPPGPPPRADRRRSGQSGRFDRRGHRARGHRRSRPCPRNRSRRVALLHPLPPIPTTGQKPGSTG